jgi:hypothetical protein
VSTPFGSSPLPAPTIPLSPEVRAAYQDLYDTIQTAIDSTMDLETIEALNKWQPQIGQVLTQDAEYTLNQDTNLFTALEKQIQSVNDGLTTLRSQISSIASHFAIAGDITAAIDKILTLVP